MLRKSVLTNLRPTFILNPVNMKKSTLLPPALSFFMLLAAVTVAQAQVFADYDGHADFKSYKTYAWIAPGDSVLNRQTPEKLFGGFIMYTANQELKNKGMEVDTIRPSVVFVFH